MSGGYGGALFLRASPLGVALRSVPEIRIAHPRLVAQAAALLVLGLLLGAGAFARRRRHRATNKGEAEP
jgi:hypothetical protein